MKKAIPFIFSISIVSLLLLCTPRDNPFDPVNPNFEIAEFGIRMRFFDNESKERIQDISAVFSYKNQIDTAISDSAGIASIRVQDNLAWDTIQIQIAEVASLEYRPVTPFTVNLTTTVGDTDIGLWAVAPHKVAWNNSLCKIDTLGAQLGWHKNNSQFFLAYQVLRSNIAGDSIDTLTVLDSKADTSFFDSLVEENTTYVYRIAVSSVDSQRAVGEELRLTVPNRSPLPSKMLEVKGVDFVALQLQWSKNHNADFKEYVIFRSPDSLSFDSVYTAANNTDTVWIDRSLDSAAKIYYYTIKTMDTGALFSLSDTLGGTNRRTLESNLCFVPAGWFTMGRNYSTGVPLNEHPEHSVHLSSYLIDRYEVTIGQFVNFLNAGNHNHYDSALMVNTGIIKENDIYSALSGREEHPVTQIDWEGAKDYCEWAGGRLPTEAEWEKAARGTNKRLYPWGNDFYQNQSPPDHFLTNYVVGYVSSDDSGYTNDGAKLTAPVGNYEGGKSPYGCYDMTGNVKEWVADYYSSQYSTNDSLDPHGPKLGLSRVVRGGGFKSYPEEMSTTSRFWLAPTDQQQDLGFRCVREVQID